MSRDKRLSVPAELLHLIEKRKMQERREDQQRSQADRRECDSGPLDAVDSVEDPESPVTEDQRSGEDRRKTRERRQADRREEDSGHDTAP